MVNINGKLKSSRKQAAHLHFDFRVEFIGKQNVECCAQIKISQDKLLCRELIITAVVVPVHIIVS